MRNRFKKGDVLEVLSPDDTFLKSFVADEIYDSMGAVVEDAKLVQEKYRIRCPFVLKEGAYLRRKAVK
jgi:hypothetical protein